MVRIRNTELYVAVGSSMSDMSKHDPSNAEIMAVLRSMQTATADNQSETNRRIDVLRSETRAEFAHADSRIDSLNMRVNALSSDIAELAASTDQHVASLQAGLRAIDARLSEHIADHRHSLD